MREYTKKLRKRGTLLCVCAAVLLLIGTPLHVQALNLQQKRSHIIVEDASGHWLETNDLEIFGSGNEKKIIMDDSQGEYEFSIFNHGEYPSKYLLTIKESNHYGIPIEYQLLDKNGTLLSGNEWKNLKEPIQYEQQMQKEQKDDLLLKWRWKPNDKEAIEFETGTPYTVHLQIDVENVEKLDYLNDETKEENKVKNKLETSAIINKIDHVIKHKNDQKETLSKDSQSVKEQEEKEVNSKGDEEDGKAAFRTDKGLPLIWLGLLILILGIIFLIIAKKKDAEQNA